MKKGKETMGLVASEFHLLQKVFRGKTQVLCPLALSPVLIALLEEQAGRPARRR